MARLTWDQVKEIRASRGVFQTELASKFGVSRRLIGQILRRSIYRRPPRIIPPHYLVDPDTDCWVWQRALNRYGYGILRVAYKGLLAHRWMYEKHHGPIPIGESLDHLCRNPRCVNPKHLEVVSHATNVRRGLAAKLDWETVARIRHLSACGLRTGRIAAAFGVHRHTIQAVITNSSWRKEK